MKKGSIFSVLIVIVLLTMSFTGCFSDDDDKDNDNEIYSEVLTINVDTVDNNTYNILLPVLIDQNKNQVKFEEIQNGDSNLTIPLQYTEFGIAYNLSGNGNYKIIMRNSIESLHEEYFSYSLSMLNQSESSVNGYFNFRYYISSITNNIKIEYSFLAKSKHSGRSIGFNLTDPMINQWGNGMGFGGGGSD